MASNDTATSSTLLFFTFHTYRVWGGSQSTLDGSPDQERLEWDTGLFRLGDIQKNKYYYQEGMRDPMEHI